MQSRLEQYLDEVSQPLPASERQEWRTEAEQHLSALIKAYEELGHSRDEATKLALAKFGEADIVGERMRVEAVKAIPIPISLKIVAAFWVWGGLKPLMLFGLADRHPGYLLWGMLSLTIAAALIRRHPFARIVALVWCAALSLSAIPYSQALFSGHLADAPYSSVSRFLDQVALAFGQGLLQIWLLTRPQVRAIFPPHRRRSPIRRWR